MAEDLIELGIEGIDKLVDKHFHKAWDGEESDESENEPRSDYEDLTKKIKGKRNSAAVRGDVAYNPEREQSYKARRRQRTGLPPDPSASNSGGGYEYVVPPPTSGLGLQDNRRRRKRDGLVRRSSSQQEVFGDNDRKTREDRERDRRRKSFSDERRRDIEGAERGNANGGGQNKTEKVVLTLLGAAMGGLAVRAVINRLDKKSGKEDDMRSGGRARTGDDRGGGDEKPVVKERGRR